MTLRIRQPQVTDTNGNALGTRLIRVEFDEQGPATVMHDGQRYDFTGKTGTRGDLLVQLAIEVPHGDKALEEFVGGWADASDPREGMA